MEISLVSYVDKVESCITHTLKTDLAYIMLIECIIVNNAYCLRLTKIDNNM